MNACDIRPACAADSALISSSIVEAIGLDHAAAMLGSGHTADDARELFRVLALDPESQYYWGNTLVAADPATGEAAGVVVSYPGADLLKMRPRFINLAAEMYGRRFGRFDEETFPGEYYIDTLAVEPPFRGRGIARDLLRAAAAKAPADTIPTLLVDPDNTPARRLYLSEGFTPAGTRLFAGTPMIIMQKV